MYAQFLDVPEFQLVTFLFAGIESKGWIFQSSQPQRESSLKVNQTSELL